VRKIGKAKWNIGRNVKTDLDFHQIPADAVTADLRTSKNSLSFWRSETEADLGNAVLAIVANRERIDPIDFIWLKYQELEDDGHSFEESEGQTPVIDLVDRHVDITSQAGSLNVLWIL